MVWYSHLFKNSPDFVVVNTVKGFVIVNKAEIDVFLDSCFLDDPMDVGNLYFLKYKHNKIAIYNNAILDIKKCMNSQKLETLKSILFEL